MLGKREPVKQLLKVAQEAHLTRRQLVRQMALLGLGPSALGLPHTLPGGRLHGARPAQQSGVHATIASLRDIDTLDPHRSLVPPYGDLIRQTCFNSLVRYGSTLEIVPDLAESWEFGPDGLSCTFMLRSGVRYHNGQELEASHVEFSLTRFNEQLNDPGSVRFGWPRPFPCCWFPVEFVEIDPSTIVLNLDTPRDDLLDFLTYPSIITPEIAEAIETNPIGTGPFRFVEWVQQDHISLERNPDYFESGEPGLDSLTFRIIPDSQTAVAALQAGEVDAIFSLPVAEAVSAPDFTAVIEPTSAIQAFEFRGTESSPVRMSVAVRRALAHCLNKDAVQEAVFGGEGRQKWSFVPIANEAYYQEEPGYPFDLESASALLAEAGYPDGFALTAIVPAGFSDAEVTTTIWQEALAQVDVSLNVESLEPSAFATRYADGTSFDIAWNAYPGFGHPNFFAEAALVPTTDDQWPNPELAALAASANAELDPEKRRELYGQLQDLFVDDLPILVIQEVPQASLLSPDIVGWDINPLGQVPLSDVTREG
jgi:peptide/nickel transport system substrate-binding protein